MRRKRNNPLRAGPVNSLKSDSRAACYRYIYAKDRYGRVIGRVFMANGTESNRLYGAIRRCMGI